MRLLVVEDDQQLAEVLAQGLRSEGYAVDHAANAEDAWWFASEVPFDALIVDIGLPDGDGIALCGRLRAGACWAPILLLTARQAIGERVRGLDAGADDYVVKPFAFAELVARLRAVIRRGAHERPVVLQMGALRLDPAARRVLCGDDALPLTGRLFALLELLMRHGGEVVTRAEIEEHLWDWAYEGSSNVIDVYIGSLRAKLRGHPRNPVIETVRGAGYRLTTTTEVSLTTAS